MVVKAIRTFCPDQYGFGIFYVDLKTGTLFRREQQCGLN